MAEIKKCSLVYDVAEATILINKYQNAVEELKQWQSTCDKALEKAIANGLLKGEWFNNFVTYYTNWTNSYTQIIANLIVMNSCLGQINVVSSEVISQRDELNKSLGGGA